VVSGSTLLKGGGGDATEGVRGSRATRGGAQGGGGGGAGSHRQGPASSRRAWGREAWGTRGPSGEGNGVGRARMKSDDFQLFKPISNELKWF
jgi:hypothetical protein